MVGPLGGGAAELHDKLRGCKVPAGPPCVALGVDGLSTEGGGGSMEPPG